MKEFILIPENKKYKIKISVISDISIEVIEVEKITDSIYANNFSLENLIKLSRGFRICDNINEAYEIKISELENKKYSLISNNHNGIFITIKIELPWRKSRRFEIKFVQKRIK